MTDTQAFGEISSRSAAELAREVLRALERARCRPAPADDRRALDGGREAPPPAAAGDPRDRGATRARHDGDPSGTGIPGDRGSRGERIRALGRLRGAQLPG